MANKVWLIDGGHGGMFKGEYTTAPEKMYEFPGGQVAYEGVLNRAFKMALMNAMDDEGFAYIDVSGSELDIPLDERVDIINRLYQQYPQACSIHIHNNASPKHNAGGSEVWTSVGQTKSDLHAKIYAECFQAEIPELPFRIDSKTGEVDKESMFYVLKWTKCPAFLPEIGFFDYYPDFELLNDLEFQYRWAGVMIEYMKRAVVTAGIF